MLKSLLTFAFRNLFGRRIPVRVAAEALEKALVKRQPNAVCGAAGEMVVIADVTVTDEISRLIADFTRATGRKVKVMGC